MPDRRHAPEPIRPDHKTAVAAVREALILSAKVEAQILATVGGRSPEQGGLLGGSRRDGVVRAFHLDETGERSGSTYSPDTRALNHVLAQEWQPTNIDFLGFVHSHPGKSGRPSSGDLAYAKRILAAIPGLPRLLLPIVTLGGARGRARIHGWVVERHGQGVALRSTPVAVEPNEADQSFARVLNAYDLAHLARQTVVVVGVGGAAGFCEDLVRTGLGRLLLIDPDMVETPNLGTQAVYRHDIGRPKVDALADRLRDINPALDLTPIACALDDLDDAQCAEFAVPTSVGVTTLLCGFTDSFFAQARINRLALHFGWPSLCAQLYREGRGAEITFTYPGLTPACHRCVLASRYRAYLEAGFTNDVTSSGTPIFATSRVNALKGFIALALLHHRADAPAPERDEPGARWRRLAQLIATRNLVQIRLDPDLATSLGLRVFERVFAAADGARLCFDEAVWLPQQPEGPDWVTTPCPDCGGTGDLRDAIGRFADTRQVF